MSADIIYKGNSIISVETLPEYPELVIIKKPSRSYSSSRNFQILEKEYEMTRKFDKIDGVRRVLEKKIVRNKPVLILEYIDGETLRDFIKEQSLDQKSRLEIASQLASILEKIHQRNIAHLDINSKNVLIQEVSKKVVLIDFGAAVNISSGGQLKVEPGQILGELSYISPEQTGRLNRAIDERSDLYSLGVVLYELFTGKLPFDSKKPGDIIHQHISLIPLPPSQLLPEVQHVVSNIILKLLSKDAEDRYQSATGVHSDLEKCLQRLLQNETIEEFPLGDADYSSRFKFPQKLYGRESELNELMNAFESAGSETPSMFFVGGYSGIGKTALVEEIQKPVSENKGYFIRGKFDQYLRTTPYSGFTQVFEGFISQILAEPEENFKKWREKIQTAVGDLGKVLIEVIPAMEELLGTQPDVPQLRGQEAENRFNYVFISFLSAVATKEHPLAIFIDDLQWMDAASLRLLKVIETDFTQPGLMLIGAYRDNEVDNSHPLMDFINKREEKSMPFRLMKLNELKAQHLEALLSDTLRTSKGIKELEKIIFEKTLGNPFFSRKLLTLFNEEGRIVYDYEINNWVWNIADIKSESISDNVTDLLANNIAVLPEEIRKILTLAACIGNRFDIHTLAMISGLSESEVLKLLNVSLSEQYVLETGKTFEFVHDQIQQAAYSLLDENSRINKHLEIARMLLADTSESELEEKVFDIVTHYNLSAELLTNQEEKISIVELNLRAGRKARLAAAFAASAVYLRRGLTLLGESAWQDHYRLTLNVHSELIEVCLLNIQNEEVEALFDVITANVEQAVDAGVAHKALIESCTAQHKLGRAISLAEGYLERLDITLDSERESDLTIAELGDLAPMEDREKLSAMEILMAVATPVLFSTPERLPSVVYTMMNLISRYGNNSKSSYAYASYAYTLCLMQRYQEGNHFGQLVVDMLEKYTDPGRAAGIMNMLYTNVRHWKWPIHDQITPLKTCHRMAMQAGDFEYGIYSLLNYTHLLLGSGKPLEHCLAEVEPSIILCQNKNQQFTLNCFLMIAEFTLNLTGMTPVTTRLEGKWFSEEAMMPRLSGDHYLLALYGLLKIELHYLFGERSAAYDHIDQVLKYRGSLNPSYIYTKISFYGGLACVAGLAEAEEDADRQDRLEKLEQFEKELTLWAESAPMNYQHQYDLVLAEKSRINKENWKAVQLYEAAISGAKENKFIHDEALANELFAKFWLEQGNDTIAKTYLHEAHLRYHQWGAEAKVSQLENNYPQYFKNRAATPSQLDKTFSSGKMDDTITQPVAPIQIDIEQIISASQTLSSETNLDQLLSKMMKLVMSNFGAEKAVLMIKQDNEWFLQAKGDITNKNYDVLINRLFNPGDIENKLIPKAVFNYCSRKREALVIGDAGQDNRFNKDRLIKSLNIKSLACIPILSQGNLKALLYLDNSELADVFNLERVEILKHLSSQFGISVENALLYENLNIKIAELKNSEMRFRIVFNNAIEAITVTQDEVLKYFNPQITELSGYSKEEIHNMTLTDFVHPDDLNKVMREYRERISGKQTKNSYPIRIITKKGKEKFVLINSALIIWEGQPASLVLLSDITPLKQAEKELQESEERYELAIKGASAGIWDWNVSSEKVFFSSRFQELLGYDAGEFKDSPDEFWSRLHTDDKEEIQQALNNHIEERIPYIVDYRLKTKSGEYRWFHARGQAMWGDDGIAVRMSGSITDITKRKLAEEITKQSEERFRSLMEQSPLDIVIMNPDGQISQVNAAWFRNWDVKEDEAARIFAGYNMRTDKQFTELGITPLIERAFAGEDIILPPTHYIPSREFEEHELEDIKARERWIQSHMYPIKDESGGILHIVIINADITKLKQVEEKLRKAFNEIEQLKNQLEAESAYLQNEIKLEHNFENIIGNSPPLKYVLSRIEQIAGHESPVLIMGETGTGKELVARAIHRLSKHNSHALVKVNCAALPRELIESELFGHEKGAFTGAISRHIGRFELANNATIFLDEIGELPVELQSKFLRVLESGEYERLGSSRTIKSSTRIIAATNRNLEEEIINGNFREDLWYRLKVFPITIPPLRERKEDIPLLVQWFIEQLSRKTGTQYKKISKSEMERLENYSWPGNIRELEHTIESALITAQDGRIHFDLPKIEYNNYQELKTLEEMEREYLIQVLTEKKWKIGGENSAASILGMHVNTLRSKMNKLGIRKPEL